MKANLATVGQRAFRNCAAPYCQAASGLAVAYGLLLSLRVVPALYFALPAVCAQRGFGLHAAAALDSFPSGSRSLAEGTPKEAYEMRNVGKHKRPWPVEE